MTALAYGGSLFDIDSTIAIPTKTKTTATIIIDRRALFREGLRQTLAGTAFAVVAAEAEIACVDCAERDPFGSLLIIIAGSHEPMADVAAVATARTRFPGATVVSLDQHGSLTQARLLFRAGVSAILPSPLAPAGFVAVLELVLLGQHVVPPHLMGALVGPAAPDSEVEAAPASSVLDMEERGPGLSRLSAREVDIVRCLRAGEPNRSIAQRLMICEATVKVHVKAILRKIKVKNRTQAAIWAVNNMDTMGSAPLTPHLFQHLAADIGRQPHV